MADLGYTKLNGKICCNKCKEYVCGVRFIFACIAITPWLLMSAPDL